MNRIRLKDLFAAMRDDSGPLLDITDSVMLTLSDRNDRSQLRDMSMQRSLFRISMISSAAAAALVFFVLITRPRPEAINEIYELVRWAAQ